MSQLKKNVCVEGAPMCSWGRPRLRSLAAECGKPAGAAIWISGGFVGSRAEAAEAYRGSIIEERSDVGVAWLDVGGETGPVLQIVRFESSEGDEIWLAASREFSLPCELIDGEVERAGE